MYLTTENAESYIGKTLDSKNHILGAYPYTVIRTKNRELLSVDRAGVGIVIAQPNDTFNAIYFDIVDGEVIE